MARAQLDMLQGTLDVLVLRALSNGPKHGYAIARFIREGSNDTFKVLDGALYTSLHRMEERGWLAGVRLGQRQHGKTCKVLHPDRRRPESAQATSGCVGAVRERGVVGHALNAGESVVRVWWRRRSQPEADPQVKAAVAEEIAFHLYPAFRSVADGMPAGSVTGYLDSRLPLGRGEDPPRTHTTWIAPRYLSLLRVGPPALGRYLTDDECRVPCAVGRSRRGDQFPGMEESFRW